MATGPNQVYTWDITYLRSSLKGVFFYLTPADISDYMILPQLLQGSIKLPNLK